MRSLLGDGISRLPFYQIDDGAGAAAVEGQDQQGAVVAGQGDQGGAEGGEERQGRSIRESLTDAIDHLSQDPDAGSRDRGRDGRFQRQGGEGAEGQVESPSIVPGADADQQANKAAPQAWTKEAKAHWQALPPEVQQAVLKREQDVKAGVDSLKAEAAGARQLNEVIKPHLQAIREAGVEPHVGIARLLQWHHDLRTSPVQNMAKLMGAFGLDPFRPLLMRRDQAGAQPGGERPAAPPELPKELAPLMEHLRPLVEGANRPLAEALRTLGERLVGFEQNSAAAAQRQTQDQVETWGSSKPYFNDVRGLMTQILVGAAQTNQADRYLNAKGQVDLDKLYDAALYMAPEVRDRVLEEREAAAAKKRQADAAAAAKRQQEQTDRARRAGSSATGSAPGTQQGRAGAKQTKGRSVRESLMAAIAETRERGVGSETRV